jgi:aminopeptidase N
MVEKLTMANTGPAPWDEEFLLPVTVNPEHYDLLLRPNIKDGIFTGSVNIRIVVNEPRTFLAVHVRDLKVDEAELQYVKSSHESQPIQLRDAFLAPKNDFYVVRLAHEPLEPGKYELSLKFNGSLKKADIVGFYSSQYKNKKGKIR